MSDKYSAQDLKIIQETKRRVMLKDAERYEKEAARKRESAMRLIRAAEELEQEAAQNRSVAEEAGKED